MSPISGVKFIVNNSFFKNLNAKDWFTSEPKSSDDQLWSVLSIKHAIFNGSK